MEIYFLRHGKAADVNHADIPDDFSRPLTDRGAEQVELLGQALAGLRVKPDLILTSPLIRAQRTAVIVARKLDREKRLVQSNLLAPGCDLDALGKLFAQEQVRAGAVLLVGHEPDFSTMVAQLVGCAGASVELKKAGLALVEVGQSLQPGTGLLRWLVPPKLLTRHVAGSPHRED